MRGGLLHYVCVLVNTLHSSFFSISLEVANSVVTFSCVSFLTRLRFFCNAQRGHSHACTQTHSPPCIDFLKNTCANDTRLGHHYRFIRNGYFSSYVHLLLYTFLRVFHIMRVICVHVCTYTICTLVYNTKRHSPVLHAYLRLNGAFHSVELKSPGYVHTVIRVSPRYHRWMRWTSYLSLCWK